MKYFTSEKFNDKITIIRSISGELMYLVEGEEKAILVDTYVGLGSIKEFVESLTSKPYEVILTHGHVDHAMGAPEFDKVYMNRKDIDLYKAQCSLEERKGYIGALLGEKSNDISDDEYVVSNPDYKFDELNEGMIFHLGNLTIEVFEVPGHTRGSVAFLVKEDNVLILGDACNNSTFLFSEYSSSVEDYKSSISNLLSKINNKLDTVLISHHVPVIESSVLTSMVEVCDEIIEGSTDDIPFDFMGFRAYIAKECNERFERVDGEPANLIYDKNRVLNKEEL